MNKQDQTITLDEFAASVHKKDDDCGKPTKPCVLSYKDFRRVQSGKMDCPICGLSYEQHI